MVVDNRMHPVYDLVCEGIEGATNRLSRLVVWCGTGAWRLHKSVDGLQRVGGASSPEGEGWSTSVV